MVQKEKTIKKRYLEPEVFQSEYNKSIKEGQPTKMLVVYFEKIAKNLVKVYDNRNKQTLDACVNFAVSEAWLKWDKYDQTKTENIFSFFTTVIFNDLRLHYKKITKGKSRNISIEALFSGENKNR